MANETINTYLKNRFQYHAGSRVATETKQAFAQAMNPDGHTVSNAKIWAAPYSQFPKNTGTNKTSSDTVGTTNDLVTVFKTNATSAYIDNDSSKGIVWTNEAYPAVKLYENAVMTGVQYSDGPESGGGKFQAYELLVGGKRIKDWISPTAVEDDGKPVPGYSGIIQLKKSSGDWTNIQSIADGTYQWALANSRWEFVYGAGMLTFDPAYTPVGKNWPNVRITAFAYIGQYLDKTVSDINADILAISGAIGGDGDGNGSLSNRVTALQNNLGLSGAAAGTDTAFARIKTLQTDFVSGVTAVGDALSGVKEDHQIKVVLSTDGKTIGQNASGLYSLLTVKKLDTATSGYAASYELQNADGTKIGDTIDIVKDQFLKDVTAVIADDSDIAADASVTSGNHYLKFQFYVNENGTDSDDTFVKTTYVDIEDFFNTYTGINGIAINGYTVSVAIDTANNEKYLTVNANGLMVSGIAADILSAANDALVSGKNYTDEVSAALRTDIVTNQLTPLSTRMDTAQSDLDTLQKAVSGYLGANAVSDKFAQIDGKLPSYLSAVTQSSTVASSAVESNKLSLNVKVSSVSGNAISAKEDGLYAKDIQAGANISITENSANGKLTIAGTYTPELAGLSTSGVVYGVTDGDVTISAGIITVNKAASAVVADHVTNKFTVLGKEFDGTSAIVVGNADFNTSFIATTNEGDGIKFTTADNVTTIAAKVKADDSYIEVTSSGIASKNIKSDIDAASAAVQANVTTLQNALFGYTASGSVNAELESLNGRLDTLQAGKVISAVTASNSVSGTLADNAISLDVKIHTADNNILTVQSDGLYVPSAFATSAVPGFVKAGGDISITDGIMTVLSAGQLKHILKLGQNTFNGSSDLTVTAGSGVVFDGTVLRADVKSDDSYIEVGSDGKIATKQIKSDIDAASAAVQGNLDTLSNVAITGTISGSGLYSDGHNLGINLADHTLGFSDGKLYSTLRIKKLDTPSAGYAASYALQTETGVQLGDAIQITKDQFLKNVQFIKSPTLQQAGNNSDYVGKPLFVFTFSVPSGSYGPQGITDHKTIYMPADSFCQDYEQSNGISFAVSGQNTKISIKTNASGDGKYFTLDTDGLGLSGITEDIAAAAAAASGTALTDAKSYTDLVSAACSGLWHTEVSGNTALINANTAEINAITAFLSGDATSGLNARVTTVQSDIDNLSAALGIISGTAEGSFNKAIADKLSGITSGGFVVISDTAQNGQIQTSTFKIGDVQLVSGIAFADNSNLATEAAVNKKFKDIDDSLGDLFNAISELTTQINTL